MLCPGISTNCVIDVKFTIIPVTPLNTKSLFAILTEAFENVLLVMVTLKDAFDSATPSVKVPENPFRSQSLNTAASAPPPAGIPLPELKQSDHVPFS